LQKDARISQQRLEQMNLAAARLKDTLPESVRQEFQQRRSMIDSTLFRAMLDSETRINEIRVLLESPSEPLSNAARLWVEQWRRRYPGAFSDDGTGRGRWLATPEFSERCNELKAELELLTAKHEQQKAEFEKAVAELDAEMEAIANG
jgi:DNA-binding transcriptional MerR regulator